MDDLLISEVFLTELFIFCLCYCTSLQVGGLLGAYRNSHKLEVFLYASPTVWKIGVLTLHREGRLKLFHQALPNSQYLCSYMFLLICEEEEIKKLSSTPALPCPLLMGPGKFAGARLPSAGRRAHTMPTRPTSVPPLIPPATYQQR